MALWHHWAAQQFLKSLDAIEYGTIHVSLPDGSLHDFAGPLPGVHGDMRIADWRTFSKMLTKGDIGLAEAYRDGWWDSDNLADMLTIGLQNSNALEACLYGTVINQWAARGIYWLRRNSIKGSKRNIHAHYDIGNGFYKLWLDPSMSYSSALFKTADESLEQAQYNKYDRIVEQLERPSGRLLEVGCGWGGFAERALQKGDFDIRGVTISEEQYDYATKRLGGTANIVLEDYRKQQGTYDHIVSIEMFEAVGERYWPVYFEKLKSLLKEKGKAVIQTITVHDDLFERYRQTGDVVRTFIFPGGMLPSPSRFQHEAEKAGLQTVHRFDFGQDYAATLRHWLQNFDAAVPQVQAQGFDQPFIRMWRFYLACCIASFSANCSDVMQVELAHA